MSEPIKVDFSKKSGSAAGGKATRTKEVVIPPDRAGVKIVISLLITLIGGGILYYFMLPPMNFKSYDFYIFWAAVLAMYVAASALTSKAIFKPEYVPYVKRRARVPLIIAAALGAVLLVGFLISSVFFRAASYSALLDVNNETDFASSVTVINSTQDFTNVSMIDADASEKLADKVLGDLASIGLESQFDIATEYSTQINYKGSPCRVYPLKYGNVFKWLNNTRAGFPGYVIVNMNTQDTEFHFVSPEQNTDEYIKYSPTEHFHKHLKRIVRFKHPTTIIGNISFEADDNGTPYWIIEDIGMRIGLVGGRDVKGIIMVNAVTGDQTYYTTEEVRGGKASDGTDITWIDQVYDAQLLVDQYNYFGTYNGGFWNSLFGQTGVKKTTQGASYLAIDDDVYIYTGVTSVTADESILGFILMNQRTKDAKFYSITGATEVAAMNSANGALSDKGWQATFPLLINLDGEATYFVAMKDDTNVVKSYAMVNVSNYNIVATDNADGDPDLIKCINNYQSALKAKKNKTINVDTSVDLWEDTGTSDSSDVTEPDTTERNEVTGTVTEIRTQIENGSTCYYIRLTGGDTWYKLSADELPAAIFINEGDRVSFNVIDTVGAWQTVDSFGDTEAPSEPSSAAE